jgi:hypothetical protein
MQPMSVQQDVSGVVGIKRLFSAREWRRVPCVSKVFLSIVFIQTVAYIIMRALKFNEFSSCQGLARRDQTWILIVAVVLNVAVVYFAINAVIRQKITELYSFMFASFFQVWALIVCVLSPFFIHSFFRSFAVFLITRMKELIL